MASAGGDADVIVRDLVDQPVLVGDPAGPVPMEAVLQRLRLADAFIAVVRWMATGPNGADERRMDDCESVDGIGRVG